MGQCSRVTPDPAPLGSGASPSSSRPATVERMLSKRMEHVGIVVEDMAAATAFTSRAKWKRRREKG